MAISRSENSQNWRRQLQSLRRSSSPFSVPPSLARSLCASGLCGQRLRRRRCEKADERKEKEQRGGGGEQKEDNAEGECYSRDFLGVFCNEVIRALEP